MQPIDERKEWNLTSSQNENVKKDVERLLSSFDELQDRKIEFYVSTDDLTKNIRKKNTHLMPKKKKRK